MTKLKRIDAIRNSMREYLLSNAKFLHHMSPYHFGNITPEDTTPEDVPTLLDHDSTKLNSFQSAFIKLQSILATCDLRRADGYFFERIVTHAGVETQSFRAVMPVDEFIDQHTRIEDNFVAWKEVTDTATVYPQLISYLTKRPISEARFLEENHQLYLCLLIDLI